ncbi:MAG: hypothetical protein GX455_12080 [Phycisphaerae bacterium]|nr:hypothetical protein [Phycisphaerae bacterium]
MKKYCGQVVYIYAFDIAYELKDKPPDCVLGIPATDYTILQTRRSPRQRFFYRPKQIVLPPQTCQLPVGTANISTHVLVFGIGAISIQYRVPFEVDHLEQLIACHDLKVDLQPLEQRAIELARRIQADLHDHCIRPTSTLDPEPYTLFCIDELPVSPDREGMTAEQWLRDHVRPVAGLLTEESDITNLSQQEAEESTSQYLSYYNNDLAVMDWDAALVIGQGDTLGDILHVAELANVQLAELKAYDQALDMSLEQSYRDLSVWKTHTNVAIRRNLREIHVDMARLTDELENITKFFGDWHLARIYGALSNRFHLAEWHRILDNKLKTLGDLYQILQQDRNNFWMVILETTIVLLFILDLLLLFMGM